MKKLISGILVLIIAVAAVNWCINHFFYNKNIPYYWGNADILEKRNFLVKNKAQFNTLFVGSSKTRYQIIPKLFDSIVNKNTGTNIHSYNFGIDAMLPPESFFIYRNLLENDSLQFKNVVLELDFLQTGDTKNLFNWRSYYWLNHTTYHEYSSSMSASKYPFVNKVYNFSLLNIRAFEKLFNMGKFNEYVEYQKLELAKKDTSHEVFTNGFTPLPQAKAYTPELLNKMANIKNNSINASKNYAVWSQESTNKAYIELLKQITGIAQKRNINLIFLVPVQWTPSQYRELFPILKTIPEKNKILMFDYESYKPLFKPENLFDDNHVNGIGARIYTDYVAQKFTSIIK